MENGVVIVDAPDLVEKAMENKIIESMVEEKAKVGSHESKDPEGDQVFEDSIAAEIISAISSENLAISPDDNVVKNGDFNNSMAVHVKSDCGIDFEKFEEAVETPIDLDNQEEKSAIIEATEEVFMGVEPVDKPILDEVSNGEGVIEGNNNNNNISSHKKTDSGIDSEKFEEAVEVPLDVDNQEEQSVNTEDMLEIKNEKDESDRVENDNKLDDEVIEVSEIIIAADDKEITKEEVVMEEDNAAVYDKEIQEDVIVEKYENGVSNDVNLDEILALEISDNGEKEINTAQIVLPVESDSSQAVENVENLNQAEEAKDLGSLENGHEDKKSSENEDDEVSGVHINKVEEENNTSTTSNTNPEDGEVLKEIAEIPNTLLENGKIEEIKNTISLSEENHAENSEEIRRDLATPISDYNLTNGKPESSVKKTEEKIPEVKKSPISEDAKKDDIIEPKIEPAKENTRVENGPTEIKPINKISENSTTPPARPAGLGRTAPLLEPASRIPQQTRANGTPSQTETQILDDLSNNENEENDETREKLQMIRLKFLRLAHRLGQTPHNVVVAQVLYRLGLAEQLRGGRNGGRVAGFSFERASAMAENLEANGPPLDFSCTIMVLGKSGVGKSATINSIFDENKFTTDAFQHGTKKVQDVVGTVQGIKVRVIDTPGLLPSWSDQRYNEKILHSVKNFIKKSPPDIVLYLDRLDMQTRDLGDMPLLRSITDVFGPSIWFNAIVVLTHAASAPPEGANGIATSFDMFVTNRSHIVQQAIRQAAGDMRLMNPVSLVENHLACRKNRAGQSVLPNGQVWKPHLLLLSFASKILAEANTLLKLQDSPPGRPFATRTRAPPLPFLLSSLLQSRPQLKLPEEQFGDDDVLDEDYGSSDSEDDSEYDDLPPFKRLTKEQIGKLTKEHKKAYYAELEYREKLFMKKQLKEEKKRRKMMKKMAASAKENPSEYPENNNEEESGGAASVPVPMPDLALPASFDSDNPTHRYRYLDSPNQWVVRPVLDSHGWDHDIGYEGVNAERIFVAKEKIPISFSGQITKDKKDANLQMEIASSIKHGEGKATNFGLDMQSLGKDMAYTFRSETKFCNFRKNKATAGLSVTQLGDTVSTGIKIEDQFILNNRLKVVASGGAMRGRGDMAYGGSFEATLRDKDYPLGRYLSTLGLSVMDWHGDLAIGGNLQTQIPVGRSTNLIARANLNNKGSGQISVRLNSSEQLQIVLVALVPLLRKALDHLQLSQFGQ